MRWGEMTVSLESGPLIGHRRFFGEVSPLQISDGIKPSMRLRYGNFAKEPSVVCSGSRKASGARRKFLVFFAIEPIIFIGQICGVVL